MAGACLWGAASAAVACASMKRRCAHSENRLPAGRQQEPQLGHNEPLPCPAPMLSGAGMQCSAVPGVGGPRARRRCAACCAPTEALAESSAVHSPTSALRDAKRELPGTEGVPDHECLDGADLLLGIFPRSLHATALCLGRPGAQPLQVPLHNKTLLPTAVTRHAGPLMWRIALPAPSPQSPCRPSSWMTA